MRDDEIVFLRTAQPQVGCALVRAEATGGVRFLVIDSDGQRTVSGVGVEQPLEFGNHLIIGHQRGAVGITLGFHLPEAVVA